MRFRLALGALLSLGSFGPPLPQKAGSEVYVQYIGLPGDPRIGVRFTK